MTGDWAQKFLTLHARERQSEYYAKSGQSYHVLHALVEINGELAQHAAVHIVGPGVKQVSSSIVEKAKPRKRRIALLFLSSPSIFLLI